MRIRPDLLAGKLESGEFDESRFEGHPRLRGRWRELLWFIQAAAMPNGGLAKLVETLRADYATRFITASMRTAGAPVDSRYSLAQCLAAWKTFNSKLALRHVCRFNECPDENGLRTREGDPKYFSDFLSMHYHPALTVEQVERGEDCDRAGILAGLERFNWSFQNDYCLSQARSWLPGFLTDLCTQPGTQFAPPWWCPDLFDLLLDHLDRHAASIAAGIAQTEVTRQVWRELEFAISQNVPAQLVGQSRTGKTSSVSAWCAARPGRARLVTVPESQHQREFFRAHADAFGIEYNPSTTLQKLKGDVEYVHRHSGLFICLDESQFLVPFKYSKGTTPARIEWVRNQVIDRQLGCAFLATPQFQQTLDQFVKTAQYNISQWLGRLPAPVILPSDLAGVDVLAVARLNFPEIPEPYLMLIAAKAIRSEGYLKSLELCARRAKFIAAERGHGRVEKTDVQDALDYMFPGAAITPQPARAASAARARTARAPISDPPPPAARRESIDTLPVHCDRVNRPPKGEDELSETAA